MLVHFLILAALIFLNAFFTASEKAMITLNDNKIRLMAAEGDKKAKLIRKLLSEPGKFLATIQIGITLVGFLASAVATESFSGRLAELMQHKGIPLSYMWLKGISIIIIIIVLSYFNLVLGELVPKSLAVKKAEQISARAAGVLNIHSWVTAPFARVVTASSDFIVRMLGVDPHAEAAGVTEEDIRMLVDVGEEKGTIDEDEKEMINNIFEFDNKTVLDIMTHRTDIRALKADASLEDVTDITKREKYTRLPVYEDNIDNIIGILHVKDLIQYLAANADKNVFKLRDILRHPHFVPSSKKTDELFKELQKSKTHMAVVIDEYGGTAGIVTAEDLLEEIVGNIFDEHDEEEKDVEKLDENTFVINGTASLDAVEEHLDMELPVEDYDTLSGFIIGQLGRIPAMEDKPEIEFNGLIFKVEEVEEKRIAKVKICRA